VTLFEAALAEAEKRADILRAARQLALRNGLAAVTMEAIAREARVAKPTLYKYYGDKSAVFAAIVAELLVELHRDFSTALAAPGSLSERLAGALVAKYAGVEAFMAGSPHADELYNEHDLLTAPQVQAAEAESDALIVDALREGGVTAPESLAKVLIGGAYGIFRKARPGDDIAPLIRLLVDGVVGAGSSVPAAPPPPCPSPARGEVTLAPIAARGPG